MCSDTFNKICVVFTLVSVTLMHFFSIYFAVMPDFAIISGKCPYTFESLVEEIGRSKDVVSMETNTSMNVQKAPSAVVETAIVCSKQFSDNFDHDRDKILDFFSAYFRDISMHFQTLPSSQVLFRITSLTLISSKEEQPFIENLRDQKFGNASLDDILPQFINWITRKSVQLPGFDMAMLVTEPGIDKFADLAAPFRGMCGSVSDDSGVKLTGVTILDGTLKAGSQAIAHLLGAPFDDDKNSIWMHKRSSIMMNRQTDTEISHFFSLSTDKYISKFIASENSKCLKSNSALVPLVDPDLDSVLPPTILEQCRLLSGNPTAFTNPRKDGETCGLTECVGNQSSIFIAPLTYSKCGNTNDGSRCFQGSCIPPGLMLSNVGTGKFLLPTETTVNNGREMIMNFCPRTSSPFERFQLVMLDVIGTAIITLLIVPCKIMSQTKLDGDVFEYPCIDKCLTATRPYGGRPRLENCNLTNDLQKWVFLDIRVEENDFLLFNIRTNSCLKPIYTNNVKALELPVTPFLHPECNPMDKNLRWRFLPVLSEPKMCPFEDNCKPRLETVVSPRFDSSSNLVSVTVTLINMDGVAMAPAAIISWESNLTLITRPENCVFLQSDLNCKVARLLKKGDAYVVAKLEFDASRVALDTEKRNLTEQLKITVIATSAKTMYTGLTSVSNATSASITSAQERIHGSHLNNLIVGMLTILSLTCLCVLVAFAIEVFRPRIRFRTRRSVRRRHGEGKV